MWVSPITVVHCTPPKNTFIHIYDLSRGMKVYSLIPIDFLKGFQLNELYDFKV